MNISAMVRNFGLFLILTLLAGSSYALQAPYAPDANTYHLYHFDAAQTVTANGVTTVTDAVTSGTINMVLKSGATLTASTGGFNQALNTSSTANGICANAGLVPMTTFWNQTTGAFTYEAVVRLGMDPNATYSGNSAIHYLITLESTVSTARPMQFRLQMKTATTPFRVEFYNWVSGGTSILAPIPLTGPHAPVLGKWYHVAVTYNGAENTDNNFKVYWTALDSGRLTPNEILSAKQAKDLMSTAGAKTYFQIGNQGRSAAPGVSGFVGAIDEVRISNIARDPGNMLVPVELSTFTIE